MSRRATARISRTGRLARIYDRLTGPLERRSLARWRRALWALVPAQRGAETGGIEIGAGTGGNLQYYPSGARVVATDVSWAMLRGARDKLRRSEVPHAHVSLVVADAAQLPFRDGTFAWAAETLVFCEVHDPVGGLAEVGRVLAPAAPFVMLEHVRPRGWAGRVADLLTRVTGPLWGEHWNRDTVSAVRRAGLAVERETWLWRDAVVLIEARRPLVRQRLALATRAGRERAMNDLCSSAASLSHPAPERSPDTITPDELRELATAVGWQTQQDIAAALGVTQPRVSQILSGAYPVKPGPLLNLIRQLQARHLRKKPRRV